MNTDQIIPFRFESREVRTLLINKQPWFAAADICKCLGLNNPSESLRNLDSDEKGISSADTPSGRQDLLIVNESRLYILILRCRDAVKLGSAPHQFRKWVTAEVLPSIRRHGSYVDEHGNMATLVSEVLVLMS